MTKLNPGEWSHRNPHVLPGSQAALFEVINEAATGYDDAIIETVSLKTGERRSVQSGGFFPGYMPTSGVAGRDGTGHLIFLRGSTLFAAPFDPVRVALTGAPTPILEDLNTNGSTGTADLAYSGSPLGARNLRLSRWEGTIGRPYRLAGRLRENRTVARAARPL